MVIQGFRDTIVAGWTPRLGFQPVTGVPGTTVPVQAPVAVAPRLTLMERLDRWFWRQEQKRVERYLAGAVDQVDLEQRMRELDRGGILRSG